MNDTRAGGWSKVTLPTPTDLAAFGKIQAKMGLGPIYIPVAAQRQVVAGTNYRFYCVKMTSPGHYSMVTISAYIDTNGNVHDIMITPLLFNPVASQPVAGEPKASVEDLGGWSEPTPPTAAEIALFYYATSKFAPVGVHYTPLLVSKQVVGTGINYRFVAKVEVVNPSHTKLGFVEVTFHVGHDGTVSNFGISPLLQ